MARRTRLACGAAVLVCCVAAWAADEPPRPVAPAPPDQGFLTDPNVFPVAVWLQSTARAADYKAVGINLYVGLWRGPTDAQLADLKRHGMRVVCSQNAAGLRHIDDPTVVAWMHRDEPDNAQSLGRGQGYGPPVSPAKVVEGYERMRKADPSRPVFLNLGQGVAWVGTSVRGENP
jgi:hypothetical protein